MTAKKIFVLYLFIAILLLESLKEAECSFDGHGRRVSGQSADDFSNQKRPKRSPCIVGTRWRTRRCHKGKRGLTKVNLLQSCYIIYKSEERLSSDTGIQHFSFDFAQIYNLI